MSKELTKELLISTEDEVTSIALLENGRLFEWHEESLIQEFNVGDIFLGRVKKLAPNMNAAFVTVGPGKDGFLHYQDLGPDYLRYKDLVKQIIFGHKKDFSLTTLEPQPEIEKRGTIDKILAKDDILLLQITKEPISTKGPRISTQISITGRYMVLIPFDDQISLSKKITAPKDRQRLKTLVTSIKPEGFGVIVRTAAEGKKSAELHQDMKQLLRKWETVLLNIRKNKIPSKILSEDTKVSSTLRDNFNADYAKIHVDDETLAQEIETYMQSIAPERKDIVEFYDSHVPMMEYYNVEKQLKQSFGKHVNIPSSRGAYLVIEHTEALHVIDVNSGPNSVVGTAGNRDHAFTVNKLAATEIARQLRLRDMGGIIVIDFIDMQIAEHRKLLYEQFVAEMEKDKAKHKILPPSRFGLIQVTRQRYRPEKKIETTEENPNSVGEIQAPVVIIEKMTEEVQNQCQNYKGRLFLHVHPFIEAYLTKGQNSIQMNWFITNKKWISIVARDSFKYLEYQILDEKKNILFKFSH